MRQGRQLHWPPFTPLMKKLIIATVACFVIQNIGQTFDPNKVYQGMLSLVPIMVVKNFAIWQLFTYMFLHGGILHIIVNMLMLWMFGAELECAWGTKKFLKFYFMAGIFAGIVSVSCYYFISPNTPIIGASGAVYALLIAYGFMFPDRQLLFFGIFPMRTKYFVMLICIMTFFVAKGESNVAHYAHLGGIAFGLIYMTFGRWFGIFGQYKQYKKRAKRDKMKSRFKVISSEMDDEVDDFWQKHDDKNPSSWN